MMSIGRSLTLIYCQGYPISGFNPQFRYIGGGDLLGIPSPSWSSSSPSSWPR